MKTIRYIFILLSIGFSPFVEAQEPEVDTMENPLDTSETNEDKFQIHFFEALKQKAIENYERALTALDQAESIAPTPESKAAVQFEKAKIYSQLREYETAEHLYKTVLESQGDRMDVLERLYDLYYNKPDFEKALPIVKRLIPYHDDYKEDLVNIYFHTERYQEALTLLNELETIWGESEKRNALKTQIYKITGNEALVIEEIKQNLNENPKNEQDYLKLIFLYSEQGEQDKAYETAQELLKKMPESKLVHLALYKFYMNEKQTEKAIESIKIVLTTAEIDDETILKVINDFILFVNENPQYSDELETIVSSYATRFPKVFELLGDYYLRKNEKQLALEYYEKGAAKNIENFNLVKNTLLLQLDFEAFKKANDLSNRALDLFPAQPILYLVNGVANNKLNNYEKAIQSLEAGIDFVFDNPKMEKDFYEQLSLAFKAKGNAKKADEFATRASKIKLSE